METKIHLHYVLNAVKNRLLDVLSASPQQNAHNVLMAMKLTQIIFAQNKQQQHGH